MDDVRRRVVAFVDASWDPEMSLVQWRERLASSGLATPSWPTKWGGLGCSAADAAAVAEALRECGVPGAPEGVAMSLAAPTLLAHAHDELLSRHLGAIARGTASWCQLFSEPGAGSDLAGLTTKAELDGDEWIVTGQKVWNTGAVQASFGLLVARTDFDVPKHRGLTYFVLPMNQSEITVRPVRQMNGHQSFNEVFLDGARCARSSVVGEVGAGWTVALTTLANERRLTRTRSVGTRCDVQGRVWREALAESNDRDDPHRWYPQRAGRVDLVASHAAIAGRSADPRLRQQMVDVIGRARLARLTAERAAQARALGRPAGPEGSLGKIATSDIARRAAAVHAAIAGIGATTSGPESPLGGVVAEILVSVPGQSIAGGTDEIQRNILGERVLGLPREPSVDTDIAFRDVRKNS
jgi:alkylation response protein AidB-like acyl-CoA dehydrogenase